MDYKVLRFMFRGEWYTVSLAPETLGQVMQGGNGCKFNLPHPQWVILGVSTHHWHNHATVPLTADIDPASLIGGYVWDVDHGTTRQWGGAGNGKIPRITQAYVELRQ